MEKILFLVSGGSSGKSVIFEVINGVLGNHNVSKLDSKDLSNTQSRIMLEDRLLNYTPDGSINMDDTTKKLITGEPVVVKVPYQSPRLIEILPKFVVNTNHMPDSQDITHSIFRRIIIINSFMTIPPDKQDKMLAKKLIEVEASGILNWMIKGLQRLALNKKFTESKNTHDALEELRLDIDHIRLFMQEEWEVLPDGSKDGIGAKLLYETYVKWAKYSGYKTVTLRTLVKRVRGLNLYSEYKNSTTHFRIKKSAIQVESASPLTNIISKDKND